jgi:hypothetical protein
MAPELVDYMISHFSYLQCEMCVGNELHVIFVPYTRR